MSVTVAVAAPDGFFPPQQQRQCRSPLPLSYAADMLAGRSARRRRVAVVARWLLALVSMASADEIGRFAGMPVADALDVLRSHGLNIVWSSALVPPEMTVSSEPTATEPRAVLDQILAPHGLAVREVSGGRLVVVRADDTDGAVGSIHGTVTAPGDPALLRTVRVRLVGSGRETSIGPTGDLTFEDVPVGRYTLEADSPAYQPASVQLTIRADRPTPVRLHLLPRSVFLDEIIITPSHFRILDDEPESRLSLTRDEVDRMPHLADDLYRAVKRLPGASGGDVSAQFHVRGGVTDEMLVLLDGVELVEPFHLKDFQSVFSTIDAEATGGVEFLTGGFPAEYGDRMSGVMSIALETPSGPSRTSLAVGTINARVSSQGTFDEGRGHWLVSGRGWYPDVIVDALGLVSQDIRTDYADLVASIGHSFGTRSTVTLNTLISDDDLGFRVDDPDEVEDVSAVVRNAHLWLNIATQWDRTLYSRTIASASRVRTERIGGVADVVEGTIDVDDRRRFEDIGLKQDWTLERDDTWLIKWGFDVRHQSADYAYRRRDVVIDDEHPPVVDLTEVDIDPSGASYGVYSGARVRLGARVITEVGLRWDAQTWTDDHQLSPRLNLRYDVSDATTVRVAWGLFHQTQRLYELQVEDGVDTFAPAQRAQHLLASVEHRLDSGLAFRVEGYSKRFDDLRPRYENLFNPIELFPEARDDRVMIAPDGARADGVELLVKSSPVGRFTWWASAEVARVEDDIDGGWVPRSWDQRIAVSFGVNLTLPRRWNLNLAGTYHTGWPTTDVTGEVVGEDDDGPVVEPVLGPPNGDRYPDYLRFDLRVSKGFDVGRGELTVIFEAVNLTNRRNVCCTEDFEFEVDDRGTVTTIPEYGYWAPIIPSVSVRWEF